MMISYALTTDKARLAGVVAIIVLLSGAAYERNRVWQDKLTLWLDATSKSIFKARVHNNLGQAFSLAGVVDKARIEYDAALMLDPLYAEAYFNKGLSYLRTDDVDQARKAFETALRLRPGMTTAVSFLKYTNSPEKHLATP